MAPKMLLKHKFVEHIPENVEEGTIFVSMEFATAVHKCCCGCGAEVVTPLSPVQWQLTFDGKSISLYPSIGNWCLPCRSHYWIKQNEAVWSYQMTDAEIQSGRSHDAAARHAYYGDTIAQKVSDAEGTLRNDGKKRWSFWNWLSS